MSRAISPGALGKRHAGQVVMSRTAAAPVRGFTHEVGRPKIPSFPTSATATKLATDPGVETMLVG